MAHKPAHLPLVIGDLSDNLQGSDMFVAQLLFATRAPGIDPSLIKAGGGDYSKFEVNQNQASYNM